MGGGASSIMMANSPREGGDLVVANEQANDASNAALDRRLRRQRIFEKGEEANAEIDINELLRGDYIDENTRQVLIDALGGFYFLQGGAKDSKVDTDMLLRAMQKEEFEAGSLLIQEGEPGSKLYIVESGDLEVTINGEKIRNMGKGNMLGELALLYDAPRSATVRCMTKCVLWSLRREVFKQIQAVSSSAVSMQRARWLITAPDLAALSAIDLSRLVGTLQTAPFEINEMLYKEGAATSQVCLMERGSAFIYTTSDLSSMSREDIDKQLGIIRPPKGVDAAGAASPLPAKAPPAPGTQGEHGFYACTVGEGCLLGINALRAKAKLPEAWKWQADAGGKTGAISPCTIMAKEPITCSSFTVEVFENLFGPCEEALKVGAEKGATRRSQSGVDGVKAHQEMTFDSTKFKLKYVLGSGSFGVVTFAEYTDPVTKTTTGYALKSLSKATVIETGQLRHVMDERRLLSAMNSRFVLKLHGTYQTPHQLVMVTEPLDCGDLWSVIYETYPYNENDGLTVTLMCFYAASLVLALAHIHKQGIVFRDLKPENIMLDNTGYLRVIDFGFAKKVPYTTADPNTGEVKVHAKTYTLCGTPGMDTDISDCRALYPHHHPHPHFNLYSPISPFSWHIQSTYRPNSFSTLVTTSPRICGPWVSSSTRWSWPPPPSPPRRRTT